MLDGRCTCGAIRYRLTEPPLFNHCCHCSWCQRETGSAFVLNALIETAKVQLLAGELDWILTPSASGLGQRIGRCPTCRVALMSEYAGAGPRFRFVRIGTLDDPGACPPDIHIFTETRLPWVILPDDVPAVPGYYDRDEVWPQASLDRRRSALAR